MADDQSTPGIIAFLVFFALFFVGSIALQEPVIKNAMNAVFPTYELVTDVFPGEWIIMGRDLSTGEAFMRQQELRNEIFHSVLSGGFDATDKRMNILRGKRRLLEHVELTGQTLYFVNPFIAILPLHLFFAGIMTSLLSMFLPVKGGIALLRDQLLREYERVDSLLRKQFSAHGVDFDQVMQMPRVRREELLRVTTLPEIVGSEVDDFLSIDRWMRKRTINPFIPVKFYFRYRISASYGNLIQGLVSGGAAVLIFVIGLRGLKLIPSEEPSLILMALSLEFILLIVLMITFAGSAQEGRLDRVVKELEAEQRDAIKHQTDALHEVLGGKNASGGNTVSDSIADYEEQRLLDEVLSLMLREAERKRGH